MFHTIQLLISIKEYSINVIEYVQLHWGGGVVL